MKFIWSFDFFSDDGVETVREMRVQTSEGFIGENVLIIEGCDRDEPIEKQPSFFPFSEKQASEILCNLIEIIDFDDRVSEHKVQEYLLQFLWGEMFGMSFAYIEFFMKGMNY